MATSQRDYYDVLGLSRSASADDIKKAFRRLARQYHPDLHTGSRKTEMEKKFKELNEAQEVLSDPDKRKKYEQYGQNWEQAQAYGRARQHAGPQAGCAGSSFGCSRYLNDIFDTFFGGRGRGGGGSQEFAIQGEDLEIELELSVPEVFS